MSKEFEKQKIQEEKSTQRERFLELHKTFLKEYQSFKMRKLPNVRDFFVYKKGVYKLLDSYELKSLIYRLMDIEDLPMYQTPNKIKEVEMRIQSEIETKHKVTKVFELEDEPKHIINMANGLYNMEKHSLEEHNPDIITTSQIPIEYNEEAKAPRFEQFIEEITCRDKELGMLLQEITGYIISPYCNQQKAFVLIGNGRNGKSKFIRILGELVGTKNRAALSLDALCNDVMISDLEYKKLNITEEKNDRRLESDRIKSLISGEEQTANPKFKTARRFFPQCKFVFAFNGFPKFRDTSDGLYRRFVFIPFRAKFSEKNGNDDKNIEIKLKQELSGIFNWALIGLKRLQERGYFEEPEAAKRTGNEFVIDSSSVYQFLVNVFEPYTADEERGEKFTLDELYKMYTTYCADNGLQKKSIVHFGVDLNNIPLEEWNVVQKRHWERGSLRGKRYYTGLKLYDTDFNSF